MREIFARNWSAVLWRGIIALALGILILVWPGLTVRVFLTLFGIYALVDGFLSVFDAVRRTRLQQPWVARMLRGLFGIGVGIVTLAWPGITTTVLVYVIAAWAFAVGIVEIAAAVELRQRLAGEWLLAAVGILSVLFGLLLFANPAAGALALAMLIGVYFLIRGILLAMLAFYLHGRAGAVT